ncbi:hypothetical protein ANN_07674 [Periplaneta americana]|uniref:Uncharacterized protein n=1 Tax=Periplaneta americana TaxID=6978 RepID=A0ABQ8T0T2_PERAM|nr:hypothetical protein ANN_07674 [Periplaneta americana]
MASLCENSNEPAGFLKAICYVTSRIVTWFNLYMSYNGWGAHRANHTIPPLWLDDQPPLLRHVAVRPAAGSSVLVLRGL